MLESSEITTSLLIIIVDNANGRILFKDYLEQYNKSVKFISQEAKTTKEGFNLFKTQAFDCVLLDQNLPDLLGTEYCCKEKNCIKTRQSLLTGLHLLFC